MNFRSARWREIICCAILRSNRAVRLRVVLSHRRTDPPGMDLCLRCLRLSFSERRWGKMVRPELHGLEIGQRHGPALEQAQQQQGL